MNPFCTLACLSFLSICALSAEQTETEIQTVNSTPYYQYYYEVKPESSEKQSSTYYYYYPDSQAETEWRWEIRQPEPKKQQRAAPREQKRQSWRDLEWQERKTDAPAYDKLMQDLQQQLKELKREKERARAPKRSEPESDVPTYEELMRDIQKYLDHEKKSRSDQATNEAIQRYINEEERINPPSRDNYYYRD
ncbi:MAG: hypothetical protein S4CHLAM2_09870 [Chlamydiales bacterium]|nr:hypothetical protein [Chlamydiales bacterium]